jgi:hypothetical protein
MGGNRGARVVDADVFNQLWLGDGGRRKAGV